MQYDFSMQSTFYVTVYVGQLLVHICALLTCFDVIFNVRKMLMCIIGANKMTMT